VLDVVGLLLIGSIVAIAASAVQGRELPSFLTNVLLGLNLNDDSPQFVAAILSSLAAFSLILKSALSYYFGLRNFSFLATREAQISKTLASQIFTQTLGKLNRFGISEYQHALTNGASAVMGGVIGQTIALFVEVSLQISMIITLFFFSPLLTLFCLFYFLSLFLILNYFQGNRAKVGK
jgi:ABC-type multidrug transport system fused ATPase/permease subunit